MAHVLVVIPQAFPLKTSLPHSSILRSFSAEKPFTSFPEANFRQVDNITATAAII
jgi:hypothetical protein